MAHCHRRGWGQSAKGMFYAPSSCINNRGARVRRNEHQLAVAGPSLPASRAAKRVETMIKLTGMKGSNKTRPQTGVRAESWSLHLAGLGLGHPFLLGELSWAGSDPRRIADGFLVSSCQVSLQ